MDGEKVDEVDDRIQQEGKVFEREQGSKTYHQSDDEIDLFVFFVLAHEQSGTIGHHGSSKNQNGEPRIPHHVEKVLSRQKPNPAGFMRQKEVDEDHSRQKKEVLPGIEGHGSASKFVRLLGIISPTINGNKAINAMSPTSR